MDKKLEENKKQAQEIVQTNITEQRKREIQAGRDEKRRKEAEIRLGLDAIEADELAELGYCLDHQGKKVSYWDDMLYHAYNALQSEQNAYNDYRSALMSLLNLFSKMNQALFSSRAQATRSLMAAVREQVLYPLKHSFLDKMKSDPELVLPDLVHNVSVGPDNKLEIKPIERSDGLTLKPYTNELGMDKNPAAEVDAAFAKLVELWLIAEHKYIPGVEKGTYVHAETGAPLTSATFNQLKPSLDTFLNEPNTLRYTSTPTPG